MGTLQSRSMQNDAGVLPALILVLMWYGSKLATVGHRVRLNMAGALDPELVVSIPARCHRAHKNPMTHVRHRAIRLFVRPFTEPPSYEKNAMDSAGDPLSNSPKWEIWGIVWLPYLAAMGVVILIYDWLLTLDDEVRLIFSSFFRPYHMFLGSPCLARTPFLTKSIVLHQSLFNHCHCYLFKLRSVALFFWAGGPER